MHNFNKFKHIFTVFGNDHPDIHFIKILDKKLSYRLETGRQQCISL